jgi:transcriptional regulator with XRE-family HTH domain
MYGKLMRFLIYFSHNVRQKEKLMTLETANRLYELRKKNNLSQEELAEKLGVSRQAVSKWERSEASPDTDNLIALAKIYGLTLDELVYGEREEDKGAKADEAQEEKEEDASLKNEDVYINIDDGEDKVTIGKDGILVEEKDGTRVKINVNEKLMKKIFSKIEEHIDDDDDDDDDYEYDCDYDYADDDKTIVGIKLNKHSSKTRFWLEVPYPIICVVAYLIFGCYDICGGWALSWIIFVTVPVYYSFVEAIYKKRFAEFAYPVFAACVYLYLGMYHGNWHPSWLIFVTIPVYYPIAEALDKMIKQRK